ncbi:hypothetical protein [Streptomyces sp. H27-C3]|uniref:hypothetical protein n=1 Tax=Streptomyces sp. H27-C3 TaxID=3046305 RepID=UPI0024BBC6E4|nr:hypothetical protein [Streptomyces sp. H27-C3]MDJ0464861.1 hypothetical protein [Streptomyces sp. H27-C3]
MASNQQTEPRFETGSVMRDTDTGRVGVVQRAPEGPVRLHALSSDEHWDADPDDLVELSSIEALSARVGVVNYHSKHKP